MLVAIGPGVTSLQDYTNQTNAESITIKGAQGDTLDELTCVVHDPNSSAPISNEDDVVILDEQDPNGWPTVNLAPNPSFEGTYTSGLAPSTTTFTPGGTVGTITPSSAGTAYIGSVAQQLACQNLANGGNPGNTLIGQTFTLPLDENGNPIRALPYYFSTFYKVTQSFTNAEIHMGIDWKDSNSNYLGSSPIWTLAQNPTTGGWKRSWTYGTPPANTVKGYCWIQYYGTAGTLANPTVAPTLGTATTGGTVAAGTYTIAYSWNNQAGETQIGPTAQVTTTGTTSTITVTVPALPTNATGWNLYIAAVGTTTPLYKQSGSPFAGTSTTRTTPPTTTGSTAPASNTAIANNGTFSIDGMQVEYATFANVNVPASYATSFTNGQMNGTVGSGNVVTSWFSDAVQAGVTYSVVSSPALYGTAQQVDVVSTAATSSTCGIKQFVTTTFNVAGNYTLTTQYQIINALNANTRNHIGIIWRDSYGNGLGSVAANGAYGEGPSDTWQTISLQFGPGTANQPPTNAVGISLFIGLNCPSATGNGSIVLGSVTLTPFASNRVYTTAGSPLAGDGKYPTPLCINGVTGCYTDAGYTGLAYRHLRLFGGYVRHAKYDYSMSRERWIEVDGVDYGVLLAEAPATLLIRQQADTAAIAQACQYAQNLGFLVGLDYTTYVTGIATIDSMVFNWQTTRDVLSKIADMTVASYYVDYYKRLHYQPALANSAPFGVSDAPDNTANPPTYPMSGFTIDNDSSQLLNSPVIEGSTQLSTPQSFSLTCDQTTLSGALTNNSTYSTISVAAITNAIPAGTYLTLSNSGHTQQIYVETAASASATSINVSSGPGATTFQANFAYPATTTTVYTSGVQVNSGSAIVQVDNLTVGGVSKTVGLASVNQFSQGYDALLDPGAGVVYLGSTAYPANNAAVAVTYRFSFPVLVRITNPHPTSSGRKVHHHTKQDNVSSKQSAIDRANSELSQYQKAQAIGQVIITSPPVPQGLTLTAGMAIPITHAGAGYSQTLFQIQEIETTFGGNGFMLRTLKLGFYRPDFMIHMAQTRRAVFSQRSDASNDSILQDVVSVADQWAITDSLSHSVTNNGKWGGTTSSTWGGTYVWG